MLDLVKNGLLFEDDFSSNNLIWETTPYDTNRFEYSTEGLTLKHGSEPIQTTMRLPECEDNKYCITIEISHTPTTEEDIAGIILYADDNKYIECQSYYNEKYGISDTYKYIRIVADNYMYTFYKSNDLYSWKEVGNAILENSNRIGFIIHGNKTEKSSDLLIKHISIYSDNYTEIRNVNTRIYSLSFTDSNGKEIKFPYEKTNNKLLIDMTQLPSNIKGNLICKQKDLVVLDEEIELQQGNIYGRYDDLTLYVDGKQVTNELYLGSFKNTVNYLDCRRTTNSDKIYLLDKTRSVSIYNPFTKGYKGVNIALQTDKDYENLEYFKQINTEIIKPEQTIYFVMRISKTENIILPYFDKYKFLLTIE